MTKWNQKIAIFVPSLRGGGAERVMATIASALADRGHDVDLLLVQKEGPYIDELSPKVNIVDFGKRRMLLVLCPLLRYLSIQRPAVILSALGHTNIVTLIAAKLSPYRPRVVVSERSSPKVASLGGKVSLLHRGLTKVLYPMADAIVAVSNGVARELQEYYGIPSDLIQTIYNPVAIDEARILGEEVPQHAWLNGQHQVFIAVGRLTPVKDYESLLTAFSLISQQHHLARLIILGVGPSHDSLLEMAQNLGVADSVEFVGFHSNPYAWMAASDVYVLSSRSEGLPNAMIQAMACGLPVVSTDCEHGPAEILANGRWGTLVPVGDADALANAMSRALSDPSPPDVRSRVESFTLDTIVGEYTQALDLKTTS